MLGVDAQGTRFVVGDDDELRLVDADGTRVLASVPRERLLHARMGREQLLAVLSAPHELRLIDLREDRVLWTAPLSGARLYDLAWLEDSGDIAACGFSPQVELFNARRGAVARRVDVPVSCYAAHWLADGPSLVIRAERALLLWRDGVQTRIEWPHAAGAIDSVLPNIVAAADRLWIGEPASSALFELRLGGDAPVPLHRQSFGEIWDVQASKDAVYVGAADGALWRVSANDAQRFAVHDAGITDIIDGGDAIATASDDRTVAVWQPPAMSIRWRTRGHDFLVNQLWLSAARDALWSSSSDGSVKRWRWPDLDVEETVDVRALTGRKDLSLHAIWLDRMATQILLGSWNHQLVHLRRGETGWQARNFAVAGAGGYRFQEVPEAQAVVVLTTMPTRLYAWDLQQDRLIAMPDFDLSLLALAAGRTATSVFAAGPGVVIEQHLRRDADGSLRFDATTRQISALGAVTAASIDPARSCWVVAAQGQVLCIPWSWFEPSRH